MKSFWVLIISLILCTSTFSQEKSENNNYALSFGIADNFRLDKFNMDFAAKKIIDENHQLRLVLSPRISISNVENEGEINNQIREDKSTNLSLGVGADYLWILFTDEDINMFTGTGLMLTYGYIKTKRTSSTDYETQKHEAAKPSTKFGIRGTIGVEWMVSKKIGIHSEYLFTGSYNWNKIENKSSYNGIENPTVKSTSDSISLTSAVLFGISVYF